MNYEHQVFCASCKSYHVFEDGKCIKCGNSREAVDLEPPKDETEVFLDLTSTIGKLNLEVETMEKLRAFLYFLIQKKQELQKLKAPLSWN